MPPCRQLLFLNHTNYTRIFHTHATTKPVFILYDPGSVLNVLEQHELIAKSTKCEWFVLLLNITVDPTKVRTLSDWSIQNTRTDVHLFFGLASYCHSFIDNCADLAALMNELVHDQHPEHIPWHDSHQRSFDALKHALIHTPV